MGPSTSPSSVKMALIFPQDEFQHILRVLNTNVDGRHKVPFAITSIKGVGRRFANMVCKKAEVDLNKRAGELTSEEIDRIVTIIQNPRQFKIPEWFLNRRKDYKDGKYTQVVSNIMDAKLREDLERLKDQESPWPSPLLGPPCPWPAHKDHWTPWTHRRSVKEEGVDARPSSFSSLVFWTLCIILMNSSSPLRSWMAP